MNSKVIYFVISTAERGKSRFLHAYTGTMNVAQCRQLIQYLYSLYNIATQ